MSRWIRPGVRVALGDGVGAPAAVAKLLSAAAAEAGGVELILGWLLEEVRGLDFDAFAQVHTLMGGYALREPVDRGVVRSVVTRIGAAPALLCGVLRPDVLVTSVGWRPDGYRFTSESGWQRAAVDAGAVIVAVERRGIPVLEVGPPLPPDQVMVIESSDEPPIVFTWGDPEDSDRALAEQVATLVPEGARLQYGPGSIGTALLDALRQPVHIDTGVLTDAVTSLDRRGLLLGTPLSPYVVGSQVLYDWAPGRAVVDRLERTHDPARLAGDPPLVAVNMALEIDLDGQVNVESVAGSPIGGIGGHPDYAYSATRSTRGLSIVGAPTERRGRSTLVDRLSAPASTPSHDVEVVVTERGVADLRGLDRRDRRSAIRALWE